MAQKKQLLRQVKEKLQRSPRWLKIVGKVLAWTAGSLLGLVVLVVLFLQTPWAHDLIAGTVESILHDELGLELSIGELSGGFLGGISLEEVTIANPPGFTDQNFIELERLEVSYSLFDLISGGLRLKLVALSGASINLEQRADGVMNLDLLFVSDDDDDEESDEFIFDIEQIRMVNNAFTYRGADGLLIDVDSLSGGLALHIDDAGVGLRELRLAAGVPSFGVEQLWLGGGVEIESEGAFVLDRFSVGTRTTELLLDGWLNPGSEELELEVVAPNINLSEVATLAMLDLPLAGSLELRARVGGSFSAPQGQLALDLCDAHAAGFAVDELHLAGSYLDERLSLERFSLRRGAGRLSGTAVVLPTAAFPLGETNLQFYNLNPAELAPEILASLPGKLSGRIIATAQPDPTVSVELFPSKLADLSLSGLKLDVVGTPEEFTLTYGVIRLAGGRIDLSGGLHDERLDFTVTGSGLDAGRLASLGGIDAGGRLGFQAKLHGSTDALSADLRLSLLNGRYDEFTVDSLTLEGNTLLTAAGIGETSFELEAENTTFAENSIHNTWVGGKLNLAGGFGFDGEVILSDIEAAGTPVEELTLAANFSGKRLGIEELRLTVDEATGLEYRGELLLRGNGLTVNTELLRASYQQLAFENERLFTVSLDGEQLSLSPLTLTSQVGSLSLSARVDLGEPSFDATLYSVGLDLGLLNSRLGLVEEEVAGRLAIDAALKGTAEEPLAHLNLDITEGRFGDYVLDDLTITAETLSGFNTNALEAVTSDDALLTGDGSNTLGRLDLVSNNITAQEFSVSHLDLTALLTDGGIALDRLVILNPEGAIRLEGEIALNAPERPLNLFCEITELPLDTLPLPDSIKFTDGQFSAWLNVTGSLDNPVFLGDAALDVLSLDLYDYGVRLDELDVRLQFEPGLMRLTQLSCLIGEGPLTGEGTIHYGAETPEVDIAITGQHLRFTNLLDMISATVDADIRFVSNSTQNVLTGEVEVIEGNVFLPIGGGGGEVEAGYASIDEEESETESAQTEVATVTDEQIESESDSPPLVIDLRILAKHNLWIRSDLTDLEVRADLNLSLKENGPALRGQLETVRGNVYFLDKAFDLDEGTITFNRFTPPDPSLAITASSRLRRSGDPLTLVINIGGRASEPTIELSCQEQPDMPERDIMMLIALDMTWEEFQQTMDAEGAGGIAGQAANQAALYLARFMEAKLSRLARETVGLDTVKLESEMSEGGMDKLNVTVGKYLWEDIYVAYTRDMLNEGSSKVLVEYYINKYLALQASGEEEEDKYTYRFNLKWKFKY
ncbi:translocation/assembly module TamB domain-containing protein [bacterium]|nr:translocation/assembly module TamB domain-containing protein [bacterium]